jgi:hypothetical protein
VSTRAGVDEAEHVPTGPVDPPDPVRGHVGDVEDAAVWRQLHVLRHRAGPRKLHGADDAFVPHVHLHELG